MSKTTCISICFQWDLNYDPLIFLCSLTKLSNLSKKSCLVCLWLWCDTFEPVLHTNTSLCFLSFRIHGATFLIFFELAGHENQKKNVLVSYKSLCCNGIDAESGLRRHQETDVSRSQMTCWTPCKMFYSLSSCWRHIWRLWLFLWCMSSLKSASYRWAAVTQIYWCVLLIRTLTWSVHTEVFVSFIYK